MVVHRTCSFCAGDIEPGTGQLFVKRDGSLFSFCSSSCRKQQMGLGRVGHRLRWTKAHELKRLAEQRRQPSATTPVTPVAAKTEGSKAKGSAPTGSGGAARRKPTKSKSAEGDSPAKPAAAEPAAKKPRAKKSTDAPASG
jgi:large subunit ribosomal protein L24e